MAKTVHTTVALKIDPAGVMRAAWASYYRQVGNDFKFNRKLFAAHLKGEWSLAKGAAFRRQREAEEAAKLNSDNPVVRRAAEIRAELVAMEYRDFIDWNQHRALSVELARCAA